MKVLFATGNAGKLAELQALAGERVQLVSLREHPIAEPVEDGETFEANARLKAVYYAARSGLPALADDSTDAHASVISGTREARTRTGSCHGVLVSERPVPLFFLALLIGAAVLVAAAIAPLFRELLVAVVLASVLRPIQVWLTKRLR